MTALVPADAEGPLAFVADVAEPVLDADDRHHLARVLRLRAGDPMTVGDGAGKWRPCFFGDALEPAGNVLEVPRPAPLISIGLAIVKGERPEWAVQKLTELGVDRVVLLHSDRSVVRWDRQRGAGHIERLRRVARAAAMQSRQPWLPVVEGPRTVSELLSEGPVALAARDGGPASLSVPTLVIGPEGGWSPAEASAPLPHVNLGISVLRTETAALVAGVLLVALRGQYVHNHAE